jgi:hypothetical protein
MVIFHTFKDFKVDEGFSTAASIIITSINIIASFYLSGFVLIITIIKLTKFKIKEFFEKRKNSLTSLVSIRASSELLITLRDEELSKKFKKFCESEWSVENYLAYYDVKKYLQKPQEERKIYAEEMMIVYFNGSRSELEVNMPQKICSEIRKKIEDGILEDDLFDLSTKIIVANLQDTMSRFQFSIEYETYMNTQKLLEDQINH